MEKEVKKVYLLTQKVLDGAVLFNLYCSAFKTKELAEKTKKAIDEANKCTESPSFQVIVDIIESDLYEAEEDVPILNKKPTHVNKEQWLSQLKVLRQELHGSKVHQATIDLVESIEMEIMVYQDEVDLVPFMELLASLHYKVQNTLEICDKQLPDYQIILKLEKLLNR